LPDSIYYKNNFLHRWVWNTNYSVFDCPII